MACILSRPQCVKWWQTHGKCFPVLPKLQMAMARRYGVWWHIALTQISIVKVNNGHELPLISYDVVKHFKDEIFNFLLSMSLTETYLLSNSALISLWSGDAIRRRKIWSELVYVIFWYRTGSKQWQEHDLIYCLLWFNFIEIWFKEKKIHLRNFISNAYITMAISVMPQWTNFKCRPEYIRDLILVQLSACRWHSTLRY